ncbi:MAG: prenyltransferase/squalene oxidase repeat-containing protein, partial [Planctomycetota bacterium]
VPALPRPARVAMEKEALPDVVAAAERIERADRNEFLPRIYELRKRERRSEALRAGGGSEETEQAVLSGLAWLARHQSPDGRWSLREYTKHLDEISQRDVRHPDWRGKGRRSSLGGNGKSKDGDTAATGLALLAFLGHGDTHVDDGPYRDAVDRALQWMLKRQGDDGDLRGGGNLYMHGVAAFALCEAYAFTRDPKLRDPAQRAIHFTVKSQHPERGGWRYDPWPRGRDVDTSVFGWMLMALKSGKLGGLDVDDDCLRKAASYLDSARFGKNGGRFRYQPGSSRTSLAMTAQGYFCHQMLAASILTAEDRASPTVRRAEQESVLYLLSNLPRPTDMEGVNFYYWYYATLALFQTGGEAWATWNREISQLLIDQQVGEEHGSAFGSWDPRGKRAETAGRVYSTALSVLCLEAYYRYAPVTRAAPAK